MTETKAIKTLGKKGLYLVSPEQKPGISWPSRPKDALPDDGQYSYYARKYMEAKSARSTPEVAAAERESDS